jgi:hypothetical protein
LFILIDSLFSFDDLLESLDSIQAERNQRRDSVDFDEEERREEREEYNLPPPESQYQQRTQYSSPKNDSYASRDVAPVETYSTPVTRTNYAASPPNQGLLLRNA